jgi:hypothetical protein
MRLGGTGLTESAFVRGAETSIRKSGTLALRTAGVAVLALALLTGCTRSGAPAVVGVVGSGNIVTREVSVADFDEIEVNSAIAVEVAQINAAQADSTSVRITADDNVIDFVECATQGRTLKIGMKPGSYSNTKVKAQVSLPTLRRMKLDGSSKGQIASMKTDQPLALDLNGASTLSGSVNVGDVKIDANGSSVLTLGGAAGNLAIDANGASNVKAGKLGVKNVSAKLNGSSVAEVNASGRLDANLNGASSLTYAGHPTMGSVSAGGSSTVKAQQIGKAQ